MDKYIAVIPRMGVATTCSILDKNKLTYCAISITDRTQKHPKYSDSDYCIEVLYAFFHDVNEKQKAYCTELQYIDCMTKEQAEEIILFVLKHYNEVEVIIFQCDAGVSRSRAVAAAISEIFGDKEAAKVHFKLGVPNTHVYKTILEVWYTKLNKDGLPLEDIIKRYA